MRSNFLVVKSAIKLYLKTTPSNSTINSTLKNCILDRPYNALIGCELFLPVKDTLHAYIL